MARCGNCNRDVGCGCNLINGVCGSCYGEGYVNDKVVGKKKPTQKIVYPKLPNPEENTEFNQILKMKNLSREEKLKRINDILERAKNLISNS
jgi:hypothetical protein